VCGVNKTMKILPEGNTNKIWLHVFLINNRLQPWSIGKGMLRGKGKGLSK